MTSLITVIVQQETKNLKLANGIQVKTNYRVTALHKVSSNLLKYIFLQLFHGCDEI